MPAMIAKLIAAWPLERYEVWLSFSDGTEGVLDLEQQLPPSKLEAVRDLRTFRQLRANRALNVLVWPGGPMIEPTFLYRTLKRE